jgi:hypothetical protein
MWSRRTVLPAATAILLIASGAHAEELEPIQGKSIDLGTMGGTVYYTVQPEGYRVVATLGADTPVRFIATLAPEQFITFSTPREVGHPAREVHVVRHGDHLFVDGGASSIPVLEEDDLAQAPALAPRGKLN